MTSVTKHRTHKNVAPYAMIKAALEIQDKNLVTESSAFKINVPIVNTGVKLTERMPCDTANEKIWSTTTLMERSSATENISAATLFLASDKAKHITGRCMVIDGGLTSASPSPY
jgi:NAD(P)-dependent dehydrogenase (short-subunit alcohol dehydrogenase family)